MAADQIVVTNRHSKQNSPPIPGAHARLLEAEALRRAGHLEKAQSLCEAILAQHPTYVGALQTLGAVHSVRDNPRQALSCFMQAAMFCPKDWVNLTNLATALLKSGGRQLAQCLIEQAKALKPDDSEIYRVLAEIHREERQYQLAAECFRKAHDLAPPNFETAHALGDCYFQMGFMTAAAAALELAHKLEPRSVHVLYSLSQLPSHARTIDLQAALDRARRTEALSHEEFETALCFVKASVLERNRKYRESWEQLVAGNRRNIAAHAEIHRRNTARMTDALKQAHRYERPPDLPAWRSDCPVSLFILGPSRSGKTSLEFLLSHVTGVKRGYESCFAEKAAKRTSQQSGLLTIGNPDGLPASLDNRFAEIYVDEITSFAGDAKIVTDTYPAMISYVGKVAGSIPNCRFVFMKRNNSDLALRIFMRLYKAGNHYGYDLKTISEYVTWYNELAALWLEKFPEVSIQVDYEDMIVDPRAIVERVARLCGAVAAEVPLPGLCDDRGCSLPYQAFMGKTPVG
jgi:tetratricopeptide (TPR) repeat protein